ncbi:cytochrome P450 [Streptomonospora halophila]
MEDRAPRAEPPERSVPVSDLHTAGTPIYADALDEDLPAVLERLRQRHGALAPVQVAPGVGAWVTLSYDVSLDVLRDRVRFPRDPRRWREAREGRATPETVPGPFWYFRNALASDEPDHSRYRSVIVDALARITRDGTRLAIADIAADLLAAPGAAGRIDVVADYAFRLPLLLLNRYFGLDDAHGRELTELMRCVWDGGADAEQARMDLFGYAQAVTAARRAQLGADVVSRMIAHPHGLDDEEVAHQLILVISAAHDPLMNLIANTVHVLLTDRGIRADVAGARTRIDEAIDTVLWRSPPITLLPGRYAARDMEVAGARVREGDCLIIGYGPAHADPQVAPGIDTAALSGSRAHLAFGAGAHQCPAHNLARQIGIDAVAALLHHMPDLRLAVAAEDLVRRRSPFAHGLHALPAACTPIQRDADSSPLFPSAGGAPCPHAPSPSSWSRDRPTPRHASSTRPARWRAWWSRIFRFGR